MSNKLAKKYDNMAHDENLKKQVLKIMEQEFEKYNADYFLEVMEDID